MTFSLRFFDELDDDRVGAIPIENRGRRKAAQVALPAIRAVAGSDDEDDAAGGAGDEDFIDDDNDSVAGGGGVIWDEVDEIDQEGDIVFDHRDTALTGPNGQVQLLQVQGGRAAAPKAVKANCDEEDMMLVYMKNQGYSDKQVVDAFAKSGRTVYAPNSINGRFIRLLRAQEIEHDDKLERKIARWTETDDMKLVLAYEQVDEEIHKAIIRLRNKRFRMVAAAMRKEEPSYRYSPKACYERFSALFDGSAYIPYEVDDEPQQARAEWKAERDAIEAERKKNLEIEKAANARRAAREAKDKEAREKKAREQERRKAERLLAEAEVAANNAAERKAALFAHQAKERARKSGGKQIAANDAEDPGDGTQERDPRALLNKSDLVDLCKKKNVNPKGTKHQLVARLYNHDERNTMKRLKDCLQKMNRKTTGTKQVLLYRLADQEARQYNNPLQKRRKTAPSAMEQENLAEELIMEELYLTLNHSTL